ncbi:MAG TPA: pyridoxal-dependent decarboxylase, partial [Gaiellaceae bacterium]|nr:pyridoxal-dependent decarboxylase [Gaiellaceae bacterium]
TDTQGRMRTEELPAVLADGVPTIVCAQAGEVNTGAVDDLEAAADASAAAGAWLHVDGAFGLWAAASTTLAPLVRGHARADSWATDGHKWLNVPYDCGIALCAHPEAHAAAMEYAAPYLAVAERDVARDPMGYSPEFSRRARSLPVWAALRSLGRDGLADLVERTCAHARAVADGLSGLPGFELLNDVVLNQVLFRFADDETTRTVVAAVQQGGEAWMSGTTWDGRAAIRISISGWRTDEDDVARTVAAFERAAAGVPA